MKGKLDEQVSNENLRYLFHHLQNATIIVGLLIVGQYYTYKINYAQKESLIKD